MPATATAKTKHKKIPNKLLSETIQRKYKPGRTLPCESQLISRFGESRITVKFLQEGAN